MPPKKDGKQDLRTAPVVNRTTCTYSQFHVIESSLQSNTLTFLGTLTTYLKKKSSIEPVLFSELVAMGWSVGGCYNWCKTSSSNLTDTALPSMDIKSSIPMILQKSLVLNRTKKSIKSTEETFLQPDEIQSSQRGRVQLPRSPTCQGLREARLLI